MSVLKTLARIRPAFLRRAINRMARGAGVRADFQEQLEFHRRGRPRTQDPADAHRRLQRDDT